MEIQGLRALRSSNPWTSMEILGLRSSTLWRNYGDPRAAATREILKPMDFYGNPRPQILNSMEKLWRS
jgi:hypothetical protein